MCRKISALLLALFWLSTIHVYGQKTGRIYGLVIDGATGETLLGANVVITGTTRGTATDLDGRYEITGLEPGEYSLTATYVSFQPTTITGIKVGAGEAVKMDFTLTSESIGLEEITVSAASVQNTDAALISLQKKAIGFQDGISAEMISKTGSGNAAAAFSKVSGATVEGGKYVFVRGLGGRYSNARLNGSKIPSADPDRNSAQLDLFPSELLASVVAIKTFTPDLPGNFSGGTVDVTSKEFPSEPIFTISTGTSYNSRANFKNEFLSGSNSPTDWLGFDSGDRDIPDFIKNLEEIPRTQFARRDPELAQQIETASSAFGNEMIPTENSSDINNSFSFTVGNQVPVFGKKLGFIVSGSYKRTFEFYDDGVNNQFVAGSSDSEELVADFNFKDTKGTENVNWGLMSNLTYQLSDVSKIGFKFLKTQSGSNQGRYQIGNFPKNEPSPNVFFETYVLQYTERDVNSFQLQGKQGFPKLSGSEVSWNVSFANTSQEEPNLRFFFNQFVDVVRPDTSFRVFDINLGSSNATQPTRLFRKMEEDNFQANFDYTIPLDIGRDTPLKIKTGAYYFRRDRQFRERKFDFIKNDIDFREVEGDIALFFSDELTGVIDTTQSGVFKFGTVVVDNTILANNYDGDETISAAYLMAEVPLSNSLRLIGGARIESTLIETSSRDTTELAGKIDVTDVLPSLTLIYALNPQMNIRLAATQTLARPTFREIAPFTAFNFAGGRVTAGNPLLKRTLIQNFDARFEWYPNPGELFSVSAFAKFFDDPIERVIVSNNNQESFQNVEEATVFGLEFEAKKNLSFLSERLRYFSFGGNYALIRSEVDVPQRELEFAEGFNISTTRQFQGQSDFVVNILGAYDNPKTGTSVSVSYNRFGDRLVNVGLGGTPSIFEKSRDDLFLSVSQEILRKIKVSLSIDNLLDSKYRTAQDFRGNSFTDSEFKLGRTFGFSVRYNFY